LTVGLATGYGCTAGTPSNNLDLAPGYLHLLESLKKGLAGERFASEPDLKQAVLWIDRNADISNAGIQASVPRWDKFLNASGEYVEV
jgi:hypothetical protein